MHYYPFHIGDYRKDTSRLNFIEHGIYRLLIDEYYLTEHPLISDKTRLMRSCGVRTKEEIDAFEFIIDEFFVLTDDGYLHYGCEKVLKKIYGKSESARNSAKIGWEKRRANALKSDANALESDANALKSDAFSMLPITHNPIPKDIEADASSNKGNQVADIQSLYNQICKDLPKCQNLNDTRKKRLLAQSKKTIFVKGTEYKCNDLDFWEKYFYLINSIDWLNGRTEKKFNIDFDYVIRESNIIRFCESAQ